MYTFVVESLSVNDGEYCMSATDGTASMWTRNTNFQVMNLPSWNEILADLIDSQGDLLIGKTITVDVTNANVVVVS